MIQGKKREDYLKENVDNRVPCSHCNGSGYMLKPKAEVSKEYPRMVEHPNGSGEKFLIQNAEHHKAFHPKDHAALHGATPGAPVGFAFHKEQ